jgi:hypothetical protein
MFALGNDEAIVFGELLSRQVYFEAKGELTTDDYFFNTFWDLASAVNLNDHRQRTAVKNLQQIGLIDMRVRHVPPKRYFRVENRPLLLANVIRFGIEKAERIKKDHNFEIFKESILTKSQNHYNKNNGERRVGNFDPTSEEQIRNFDPELAREIIAMTPFFEGAKELREDDRLHVSQSALIANLAPVVFRPQEWFEEHYPPNQPSEMPQDERKQGRQG